MQFTVSVLIDLYCQNHFLYFISTKGNRRNNNQSRIRFGKTRTTTNQICGNVKKEPS